MAKTVSKSNTPGTATHSQPSSPPPQGTVAYLLSTLPSIHDGQTVDEYTQQLAMAGVNAQVSANAYRLKLGMELLAAAPKARAGRTAWEQDQAKRLGVGPRHLRTLLGSARAVRLLALKMPIAVLDRPLNKLPAAAKAIRNDRDPDEIVAKVDRGPKPVAEVVQAAVGKLETAIRGVPVEAREELIGLVMAAMRELGRLGRDD